MPQSSAENNPFLQQHPPSPTKPSKVLIIQDEIIAACIITPLVVSSWRGLWILMDLHAHLFPITETYFLSTTCTVVFTLMRESFEACAKNSSRHIWYRCWALLYTCSFFLFTVMHWRSIWVLMGDFVETHGGDTRGFWWVFATTVMVLVLITVKSLKSSIAPPLAVCTDLRSGTFGFPTRFGAVVSVFLFNVR